MEPREFHWPFSAIYSCIAITMEPAYTDIACRVAPPEHAQTLLDIGGGDGRLAVALAKQYPHLSRIVTADISKDMANRARKRVHKNSLGNRICSEIQDVHNLGYENNHFDVIVSFSSLHHWSQPTKALLELYRVLKPKGTLAIFDGFNRPSFKDIRRAVSIYGGSIWTAIAYWLGSKDFLLYNEVLQLVENTGINYISVSRDDLLLTIRGVKEPKK